MTNPTPQQRKRLDEMMRSRMDIYRAETALDLLARVDELEAQLAAKEAQLAEARGAIVRAGNALVLDDLDEAYHELYMFAHNQAKDVYNAWPELEALAREAERAGKKESK